MAVVQGQVGPGWLEDPRTQWESV